MVEVVNIDKQFSQHPSYQPCQISYFKHKKVLHEKIICRITMFIKIKTEHEIYVYLLKYVPIQS